MKHRSIRRTFNFLRQFVADRKIRTKILASFLLLILVPFAVIGLLINRKSEAVIQQKTGDYTADILSEISKNINSELQDIERLYYTIITNKELRDTLIQTNRGFDSEVTRVSVRQKTEELLYEAVLDRENIHSLFLVALNGEVYHQTVSGTSPTLRLESDDLVRLDRNQGDLIWFKPDEAQRTIPIGSAFNDVDTQRRIGYFLVNYRESALLASYSDTRLNDNSLMFIVDREGRILSHADEAMFNRTLEAGYLRGVLDGTDNGVIREIIDGKKQYVSYQSIGSRDWKMVSIMPGAEYEKEAIALRNSVVTILIVVFALAVCISYIVSSSISSPVHRLAAIMRTVDRDGFEQYSDHFARDEIGMLSHSFNRMVKRINYLITKVYQEQLLKQQSELKYLMFQINPHFLFNTLETINWMSRIKGVPEVGVLTKMLGDLMREGIKGKDFIPLAQELDNVEKYATIQKYRYGDKFDIGFDIDETAKPIMVPKFMLQPLVENALVHGLESKVDGGYIRITARAGSGVLTVTVQDNGTGMAPDKLEQLIRQLDGPSEESRGIGVSNVHQRIRLHYGAPYGLELRSESGLGTSVTVTLPA